MKIKILTNKLKYDIQYDFKKTSEFFRTRLPFTFEVVFQEVDIPTSIKEYKTVNGYDSITGKPTVISYMGLQDSVKDNCRAFIKDGECDIAIFAYDIDKFVLPSNQSLTSWTNYLPLYKNTEFIQLAVNSYLDNQGLLWQRISHELLHAICYKLSRNFNIDGLDEMDITKKQQAFYKNNDPYAVDGNYALTLKNITPYLSLLTKPMYKYFKDSEIVGLKPELVSLLDKARDIAGVPFRITSGLRSPAQNALVGGVDGSSHEAGLAVDLAVADGVTGGKILLALVQVGFTRFGFYRDGHLHVDLDSTKPNPCYWVTIK